MQILDLIWPGDLTAVPSVVLNRAHLELLLTIPNRDPRTRWLYVSLNTCAVYACDGARFLRICDKTATARRGMGPGYSVASKPLRNVLDMMLATDAVLLHQSTWDCIRVCLLKLNRRKWTIEDGARLSEIGEPSVGPVPDEGVASETFTPKLMDSVLEQTYQRSHMQGGTREFDHNPRFVQILTELARVSKAKSCRLTVGETDLDALVYRFSTESTDYDYAMMPRWATE